MKLATLNDGSRDGRLVIVSSDGARYLSADKHTMQQALDNWTTRSDELLALHERVERGEGQRATTSDFAAPLPRAWQWLDGSAFDTHGELMQKAFNMPPIESDTPLMYQGMSHRFLGAQEDVPIVSETGGIDFEGEFGVIVDDVPMGTSAADAMGHIKLIVQINDWSLRATAPAEMKTGFGFIHAKPACSVAPFAVTPDELGDAWQDGRVHLPLDIRLNDAFFGCAHGGAMSVGFHDLVAHAAATRDLCAGTIVGSGTVSNDNYREVGSSCISERRAIDMIDGKEPMAFMSFGDNIYMESKTTDGKLLFGAINQRVVQA